MPNLYYVRHDFALCIQEKIIHCFQVSSFLTYLCIRSFRVSDDDIANPDGKFLDRRPQLGRKILVPRLLRQKSRTLPMAVLGIDMFCLWLLETFGTAHLTQSSIMLLTTPTILTFIQVVSIFKVAQFKNNLDFHHELCIRCTFSLDSLPELLFLRWKTELYHKLLHRNFTRFNGSQLARYR